MDETLVCVVACRGRYVCGGGQASQVLEPLSDQYTNTVTSVAKDNYLLVEIDDE